MSGPEMQREKEKVAQRMREKQAAGLSSTSIIILLVPILWHVSAIQL